MDEPEARRARHDTRAMQLRMTEKFHALFSAAAEQEGLTLSAWARSRLLQAARREVQPERAKRVKPDVEET